MNMKDKMIHAVTEYDRKQSTRRGYNIYALAQYMVRVDDVISDIEAGANPHDAIIAGFSGPLRTAVLKGIGLRADHSEAGAWAYQPVARKE